MINDEIIFETFYQVTRQLERYSKSHRKNVNSFSGQYRCLFLLDSSGSISQRRMSMILEMRATSLSELLSKLEKKDFIQRVPSTKDKRTYVVSLTDKGRQEVARVRKERLAAHNELIIPLSESEKEAFYQSLIKIKDYYARMEEMDAK